MDKELNMRDLRFLKAYTNKKIVELESKKDTDQNLFNSDEYNSLKIIYQKASELLKIKERFINQD
jgi:hypothetical protein